MPETPGTEINSRGSIMSKGMFVQDNLSSKQNSVKLNKELNKDIDVVINKVTKERRSKSVFNF
jgi:hypothetical protein